MYQTEIASESSSQHWMEAQKKRIPMNDTLKVMYAKDEAESLVFLREHLFVCNSTMQQLKKEASIRLMNTVIPAFWRLQL